MIIRRVIFDITSGREAMKGQVDAIESLLYDHKDTILVAATGYGKSMILYAFAALSRKITIIVVPLTKLGKNQRDDIEDKVANSKPVWIDAETPLQVRLFTYP
jgi:superfamily II DNA helicase RecQ